MVPGRFDQGLPQQVQPGAGSGTDTDARDSTIGIPLDSGFDRGGVDLVPYQDLRHLRGADLLQDAIDGLYLRITIGTGGIHHMQQQIGCSRFLQGGVEGRHQGVRQIAENIPGTYTITLEQFTRRDPLPGINIAALAVEKTGEARK